MTDFIEGAAYVSPSRQELYSGNGDGLYTRGGDWVDPATKSMPDDLVMIWAPGDESPTRVIRDPKNPGTVRLDPPVALKAGDTFYPSAIHRGVPIHTPYNATHVHGLPATHPFGGTLISSKDVPQETVMRIFESATNDDPVVKYDPDGTLAYQHPKTRGWFYPTRYNEEPGYYEDELPDEYKGRWRYDRIEGSSRNRWHKVGTDTWYKIPVDERHVGITPLAVRWVGELNA